jgi:hypothetical protein
MRMGKASAIQAFLLGFLWINRVYHMKRGEKPQKKEMRQFKLNFRSGHSHHKTRSGNPD